jgi:outer membrane protein TolC
MLVCVAFVLGCANGNRQSTQVVQQQTNVAPPAVAKLVERAQRFEVQLASVEVESEADATGPAATQPTASESNAAEPIAAASTVGGHNVAIARANALSASDPSVPPSVPPAPAVDETSPTQEEQGQSTPSIVTVPIDLSTALQLAAGENPQVAFARERIQEAVARRQAADSLWIPSLRAGANYNKHEGRIQDVAGNIIETSRNSAYAGFGAAAVGAGSPAVPGVVMNFHLRDAIFQPRIAGQVLGARQQASQAATNDVLLNTAIAYLNLLEAVQTRAVAEETLANAQQLAELTASFAEAGQGTQADADRASTELAARRIDVLRAQEAVRVAAVRLSQILSQDPSQTFAPQEPVLVPIELISSEAPLADLLSTGLTNRPELAEARYLVGEASERLRRERCAPLVPSVLLGLSYGGNGGGLGADFRNFGDRMDFDAVAYWEIRNLGCGERAARAEAGSFVRQTQWRQVQLMDQVAAEISEAQAQVVARKQQIAIAEAGAKSAVDSFRRNADRIRDNEGLPIETLQSIQALDQARRQYVRAVAHNHRAQFQHHRALGRPSSHKRPVEICSKTGRRGGSAYRVVRRAAMWDKSDEDGSAGVSPSHISTRCYRLPSIIRSRCVLPTIWQERDKLAEMRPRDRNDKISFSPTRRQPSSPP